MSARRRAPPAPTDAPPKRRLDAVLEAGLARVSLSAPTAGSAMPTGADPLPALVPEPVYPYLSDTSDAKIHDWFLNASTSTLAAFAVAVFSVGSFRPIHEKQIQFLDVAEVKRTLRLNAAAMLVHFQRRLSDNPGLAYSPECTPDLSGGWYFSKRRLVALLARAIVFDDYIGTTLLLWFPYEQWKPKLEMAADKFFIGDARIRFLGDENEARALALAVERRLIALQESGRIAQICQWREDDACEADDETRPSSRCDRASWNKRVRLNSDGQWRDHSKVYHEDIVLLSQKDVRVRRTDARQMAGLALHCYKRGWDKIISTYRDRSGGRDTPEAVEALARAERTLEDESLNRRAAQMMMFLPMEYVRLYSHFPVWNIARGEYLASVETLMHEQWNKLLFKGDEGEFGMAGAISNGVRPTHVAVTPYDPMFEACNLTPVVGPTLGPTEIDAHLKRTGSLQEKDWVSDVAHVEYCMARSPSAPGVRRAGARSRGASCRPWRPACSRSRAPSSARATTTRDGTTTRTRTPTSTGRRSRKTPCACRSRSASTTW